MDNSVANLCDTTRPQTTDMDIHRTLVNWEVDDAFPILAMIATKEEKTAIIRAFVQHSVAEFREILENL